MPALPWVQPRAIDPTATYMAMASCLPLKRHRSITGFLRHTLAIRRQLAHADGLVGYALDAEIGKKTFWTFSVWETREDLEVFARSEPHRRIIEHLRPLMEQTRFEFFPLAAEALPLDQMKAPLR
jgi:heme-degrading monooxygenase HmoA